MGPEIIEHLSRLCGESLPAPVIRPVTGGSINETYRVQTGGYAFFVKLTHSSKIAMFEAEAEALKEIGSTHKIKVPEPIGWGLSGSHAYLVLEWLDLDGPSQWGALGANLAALHRVGGRAFGWQRWNTIGSTPQPNVWSDNWAEFFWHHRLSYQLGLAQKRGFSSPVPLSLLQERVLELLSDHRVIPSLVHGDLWGGNCGFDREGEPVIFDPALYYGDREVDIAMTELFGGFGAEFYRAYDRQFPIPPGYNARKTVYNLYHILNHFNLFGGSYQSQAQQMISLICNIP